MADNESTINQLNSFLRGEISAVETYRQALEKVTEPRIRSDLQSAHKSHQQRVEALRASINRLGGNPASGSGVWGAFAKLIEGGAKVFGDKAAISALEEGEDHGLKDYRTDLSKVDTEARRFVEQELLPAQMQTHRLLSNLKHSLEQGAPRHA